MIDYNFKGQIELEMNIPFSLQDGIARFDIRSKSALPFYERHVILEGSIDSGNKIYLLIDHFYDCEFDHAVYEDGEVISVHTQDNPSSGHAIAHQDGRWIMMAYLPNYIYS